MPQINLRLEDDVLARIDECRGDESRNSWMAGVLSAAAQDPHDLGEFVGGTFNEEWLGKVDKARGTIGRRSYVWGAVLGWIDVNRPRTKPEKAKASPLRVGLEPWERPFNYEKPAHADTCSCNICVAARPKSPSAP